MPQEPLNRQSVEAYLSTARNTVKRLSSDLNLVYLPVTKYLAKIMICFPYSLDTRSSLFGAVLWNSSFILAPVSHEKRKKSSYFDLGMHLGKLSLLWHDVRTLLSGVSKGKINSYLI
jgi:hypothetical protein